MSILSAAFCWCASPALQLSSDCCLWLTFARSFSTSLAHFYSIKNNWCRQCGRKGDAIQYLRDRDGRSFKSACILLGLGNPEQTKRYLRPAPTQLQPNFRTDRENWDALRDPKWQKDAQRLVERCADTMNGPAGSPGREYCYQRGLTNEIISLYRLGYNPRERFEMVGSHRVCLSQGIVIPWFGLQQEVWKVNIRRLDSGKPKYKAVGGSANGLFGVSEIQYGARVIMVEGEFCAMSIRCAAGGIVIPVATGSVSGARLTRWVGCLALAGSILLAFDNDEPGEKAAEAWQKVFLNALRLRPTRHDANDMLMAGDDIVKWLKSVSPTVGQPLPHP